MTPADTLGYAGFQFSAELGVTKISNTKNFWDGTAAVTPGNPMAARPDSYLTTVGGYVRKGLWLPLPAFEFGAGALSILGSRMYALQGYAKMALQEGFHGWWLPSFSVRGSASQLLGTSDVDMIVYGIDLLASKAFAIGGTARIEPYFGWSMLFIDARSGVSTPRPPAMPYASHDTPATSPAPERLHGGVERHLGRPERELHLPETGRDPAPEVVRRLQAPAVGAVRGRPAGDRPGRHQPRRRERCRRPQQHPADLLPVGRLRLLGSGDRAGAAAARRQRRP